MAQATETGEEDSICGQWWGTEPWLLICSLYDLEPVT